MTKGRRTPEEQEEFKRRRAEWEKEYTRQQHVADNYTPQFEQLGFSVARSFDHKADLAFEIGGGGLQLVVMNEAAISKLLDRLREADRY